MLRGSMVALVTPFTEGGIDEAAFIALCERQIRCGSTALVPCGTTGEAPTLTHPEQSRLIELAVWAARGRVPVIAGAGSNCTRTTIAMVTESHRLGADAVLCIVPYYNRPSQEGLYRHFEAVQAQSPLPVILYDVPKRTGITLELDTIVRLSRLPKIIGIKDASGDLARAARMRHSVAADFLRLCGDDALVASFLALGAQGTISVTANVVPALCASLHRAWQTHDAQEGLRIARALDALTKALFVESNPVPVKWLLSRLGLIAGDVRLPLVPLESWLQPQVLAAARSVLLQEAEAMRCIDRVGGVAAE